MATITPNTDVSLNQKIESKGDGFVEYGGVRMSVDELVMLVFMMKSETMSNLASDRAADAQANLQQIQKARGYSSQVGQLKSQAGGGTSSMPADMKKFFQDNGIKWSKEGAQGKDDWDITKQYLNDYIDKLSSNNDLKMIKLKSIINKQQEAAQGADSMVTISKQTMGSILSNFR